MQLYGDFDKKVGHVTRYTPKTLGATVREAGLAIHTLKPINFLGGIAWWAAVRRGGVGYPDPRLVKIYDRTVVPATRFIERFITPPFGQTGLLRRDGQVTQAFPTLLLRAPQAWRRGCGP